MATEVILALISHERLPQVILPAERELVDMTIRNFNLPWRIVRSQDGFTVVIKH